MKFRMTAAAKAAKVGESVRAPEREWHYMMSMKLGIPLTAVLALIAGLPVYLPPKHIPIWRIVSPTPVSPKAPILPYLCASYCRCSDNKQRFEAH